ncbi:MAG: EamA family transporter [Nitrospiraceae bacterium]|nr:EamA family transporter [Nitrospiraceae bacterium]
MKTLVIIFVAVICTAIGETFLSYGMRRLGEADWTHPGNWLTMLSRVVTNPYVLVGVAFMACFFFLYLVSLSLADLSYVMPLTAASYILASIMARVFLKEEVSWMRWAGILIITIGITFIVMDTSQRTAKADVSPVNEIARK